LKTDERCWRFYAEGIRRASTRDSVMTADVVTEGGSRPLVLVAAKFGREDEQLLASLYPEDSGVRRNKFQFGFSYDEHSSQRQ
jgi:hypothetical protein